MLSEEIVELIKKEVKERYGREVHALETDLLEDYGLDSLDRIEMWMGLEERYHIDIPQSEINDVKTVGQLIQLVQKYVAK